MDIKDNRIVLSILFGLSGAIFFLLFLDSHYQTLKKAKNDILKQAELGKALQSNFGKTLKKTIQ